MLELWCVGMATCKSSNVRKLLNGCSGVWEWQCMGVAVWGSQDMRELWYLGMAVFGSCAQWELRCFGATVCGSRKERESWCVGDAVYESWVAWELR